MRNDGVFVWVPDASREQVERKLKGMTAYFYEDVDDLVASVENDETRGERHPGVRYTIQCFIDASPDEDERVVYEDYAQALADCDQMAMMQPENLYRIREVE